MNLIDTHAHISQSVFDSDIEGVVKRALDVGVNKVVNICTDKESLIKGLELSSRYDCIWNAAATTPHDVVEEGELFFPYVRQAALEGQLVAIGETGLDYYYEHAPKDIQKKYFRKYLELSREYSLPVIIHCRDAFEDLFSILDAVYLQENGLYFPGLLHCFTGTLKEATYLIERGWFISFSGIITFSKSQDLREVAAKTPLDKILIETDSPYLAPPPYRGKRNEPSYLVETLKCLASIKQTSLEEMAYVTQQNALSCFTHKRTY